MKKGLGQNYENRLREAGFNIICGIDEVGRGAWAGPLVAAGVIFEPDVRIKGLNDSKKLTPAQRTEISLEIKDKALRYTIQEISNIEIDQIGVGQANQKIIFSIINELNPDFALIDKAWINQLKTPHELIIKGDSKVFSIAAASVIAKVYRDEIMVKLHEQYPEYCFNENKGYGTSAHQEALSQFSFCPCHRQSYQPISQMKMC